MKNILLSLFCVLTFTFFSCDTTLQDGNSSMVDTLAIKDSIKTVDIFDSYIPELKTLLKNDSALFRGNDFSSTDTQCIEMDLELLDQNAQSVTYGIKFDAINEGDITYIFNNKRILNKIELMIYCKDEALLTSLINDMSLYYQTKIGGQITKSSNIKTSLISPDKNIGIEWQKVGKYNDLEINIFPLSSI
jgi:hypothetical protein